MFNYGVSIDPNYPLFYTGLLFLCASSTSNIGSVSHPAETGLLIPSVKFSYTGPTREKPVARTPFLGQ